MLWGEAARLPSLDCMEEKPLVAGVLNALRGRHLPDEALQLVHQIGEYGCQLVEGWVAGEEQALWRVIVQARQHNLPAPFKPSNKIHGLFVV